MKSTEQIISIVSAKVGVIIDTSKSTNQLIEIVKAANQNNSFVIIKKANKKSTEQLMLIAKASSGNVIFDLTD
ncbi:hypothetical protein CH366_18800 [Leptospira harrisiae]|nr:hypothetical protein CH366_18800 [Leptospira harrisiae]